MAPTSPPRSEAVGDGGPSWRGIVVLVGVAVGIGLTLMLAARRDDSPGVGSRDGVDEPGVAHVHGLGLNPSDGSLIVATHTGSFRIPDGRGDASRIGASFQDTMGFTVVGPDTFLGSGHPDVAGMRAGQPGRLGLIESTDAGRTWTIVSLGGEADFHALASAHDQVYGWDAGTARFMVSRDRREWEVRSTADLHAFAVDPGDPAHVVAAGPGGLLDSADGGRSWTAVDGPELVALSWDSEVGLWGADAGGMTWSRGSSGWQQASPLPGEPQAFLASGEGLYAAAHDDAGVTGLYRSTDEGRTWDLVYRDQR